MLAVCPYIAPADWGNDPARTIADHLLTHHAEASKELYAKLAPPIWAHYWALCMDASEATGVDADYIDLRVEDLLDEVTENLRANETELKGAKNA